MGAVNPTPAVRLFDRWAEEGRGEAMAEGHWSRVSQILERMALQPGMTALDVGCGTGYAVRAMAERVGPGGRVDGVDASARMIERAQARTGFQQTLLQVAPAERLPFIEAMFDRLLSVEVIYYTEDPLAVLKEWCRVLKPGGSAWVMVDYYRENPYSAGWGKLLGVPTHYWSAAEYAALFAQAGFESVRIERLKDPRPVDEATFEPGWGYETIDDARHFRERIGSLLITGEKPLE